MTPVPPLSCDKSVSLALGAHARRVKSKHLKLHDSLPALSTTKRTRDLSEGDGREVRVRLTASRSLQRSRGRWVERQQQIRGYHGKRERVQQGGYCTCRQGRCMVMGGAQTPSPRLWAHGDTQGCSLGCGSAVNCSVWDLTRCAEARAYVCGTAAPLMERET